MKPLSVPSLKEATPREIQKIVDTLVKEINILRETIENVRGSVKSHLGSENQIRVERVDAENYKVLIRTKDGWAESTFTKK